MLLMMLMMLLMVKHQKKQQQQQQHHRSEVCTCTCMCVRLHVINMLKRVVHTVNTMLVDRHFDQIEEYTLQGIDLHTAIRAYRLDDEKETETETETEKKAADIYVFFPKEEKLSIKTKRQILKKINFEATDASVIFVTEKGSTSFAAKEIDRHARQQMFRYDELVVPVVQHELVPKHRCLSPSEVKKRFPSGDYKSELPKISSTDAVVKYMGLRVDDVVEIERRSIDGYAYTFYRIVV